MSALIRLTFFLALLGLSLDNIATAYSLQPTAYSLQPTAYSLQPTAYSLQPTAYSLQPTLANHSKNPAVQAIAA